MFSVVELSNLVASDELSCLVRKCRQFLLEERLKVDHQIKFSSAEIKSLSYFSSLVVGGLAFSSDSSIDEWRSVGEIAGDFEYTMFLLNSNSQDYHDSKLRHIRRACLLYEIAKIPGVSSALASATEFLIHIKDFFTRGRSSNFGKLLPGETSVQWVDWDTNDDASTTALNGILSLLGTYMQNHSRKTLNDIEVANDVLYHTSIGYQFELNADEIKVFGQLIKLREQSSTVNYVEPNVLQKAQIAGLPAELWPMQQMALQNGALNFSLQSWGLAAPTGTGKTSLAQLVLISFFEQYPGSKAFYIVPSRALAAQVAGDLHQVLAPINKKVGALGSHLTFDATVIGNPNDMDVLIFTPEKADLLLRIEPELLKQTRLVIVDEAHHIEAGTRGILLEFYLWRLRSLVPKDCEIIQLSAVAPNIDEMVEWLGDKPLASYVKHDWRTGKFRIGTYERNTNAEGVLAFSNSEPIVIQGKGTVDSDPLTSLAQFTLSMSKSGIVLVLASSRKKAEELSSLISNLRKQAQYTEMDTSSEYVLECLDARLERELYSDVPLRESIKYGVAYHHGGLPSRVRASIEEAIKERRVDIICATTTLAEGVNFPFSTVIVESLIIGTDITLSPRELWNIAGRAGRFGVDLEGHCILFRPSLWIHKLTGYKLSDYLNNQLDGMPPVRSAFADAIVKLHNLIEGNTLKYNDLDKLSLQDGLSNLEQKDKKVISGLVNMIRVGLVHAHANGITDVRDINKNSFVDNLFASSKLNSAEREVAAKVERVQRKVISESLIKNDRLLNIAARVGWTVETQSALLDWINELQDWKIEKFGKIVAYGRVDAPNYLNLLLYPIAERMTEFEGTKLGGFTAYIASHWIEGHPLSAIREKSKTKGGSLRDYDSLVNLIYSRIQYLLPWALFGVSDLLEYEARNRNISFGTGVRDLSLLSSEGVPNFDALSLVMSLNLERVDATRLASSYSRGKHDYDIITWFKGLKWSTIAGIVAGQDRRRIDPELRVIHERLRG